MKNPIFQTNLSPYRVTRGGSWDISVQHLRVSDRYYGVQSTTFYFLGFRIFRTKVES